MQKEIKGISVVYINGEAFNVAKIRQIDIELNKTVVSFQSGDVKEFRLTSSINADPLILKT